MQSGTYARIDADQKPRARFVQQCSREHAPVGPVKQSLAVVALLFLLLRPLCDVWAAGHAHAESGAAAQSAVLPDDHGANSHDGEPCCESIEDRALARPSDANAIPVFTGAEGAIAEAAWTPMGRGSAWIAAVRKPRDVIPLALSYYARTARILR